MTSSTGQLVRWRLCLSDFDFDVVYGACIEHQTVNALSSLGTTAEDQTHLEDDLHVLSADEQENGGPPFRVSHTYDNEEIPLRVTIEQPLDAPFTEKVLEQKMKKYCQTAALYVGKHTEVFYFQPRNPSRKMDIRLSYVNCSSRNALRTRFIPCTSLADSRTNRTEMFL